jgi:hypothetical protein
VRLYNHALSANQIQADMSKAIGATTNGALTVQNLRAPLELGNILSVLSKVILPLSSDRRQASAGSAASRASATVRAISSLLTSAHLEIGELMVDHRWARVDFSKPFTDPVVVAKALSYRDAILTVVGIHQAGATGFELRLQPWDEHSRPQTPETVGYLVIERGRFRLADDTSLESGRVATDPAYPVHSIAFSQPFRVAPVVVTALPNVQDSMAVTGRPAHVSKKGLKFHLQSPQRPPRLDALQAISYVAWEPSSGTLDGLVFAVDATRVRTREQFQTISYRQIFATAPVFLADVRSSRGGSPIAVRWDQKDLEGIDVMIDDALDLDAEGDKTQHTDVIGYMLIR